MTSGEAREAVARALQTVTDVSWDGLSDAVLAALAPIIAAEIRASMGTGYVLIDSPDRIASRICGGDQ